MSSSWPSTGVYPFELSIPARIFGTAAGEDEPLYEVVTCSLDGGPVRTDADFAVTVEHGVEALRDGRHRW